MHLGKTETARIVCGRCPWNLSLFRRKPGLCYRSRPAGFDTVRGFAHGKGLIQTEASLPCDTVRPGLRTEFICRLTRSDRRAKYPAAS